MSTDGGWNRRVAVLLALSMMLAVLATAGCLDNGEEEEPDTGDEVPDDRNTYVFKVTGEVDVDLSLILEEVIEMGTDEFEATFVNSVGTTETANYTGVKLSKVLDQAKVDPKAEMVYIIAEDGYSAGLFMTDITDDTYLAFKKEDEWQDLSNDGALRLVDTNMGSVYWVRQIVELNVTVAPSIPVQGLVGKTDPLSTAYIHENGVDVQWTDDGKNRTNKGIHIKDILDMIEADYEWGYLVDFFIGQRHTPMAMEDLLSDVDYYLIEVFASISMIREGTMWIGPIDRINVTPGVRVTGNVGRDTCVTLEQVLELPIRDVEYGGSVYRGAVLDAVIVEAGLGHGMDAVEIVAKDGYSAIFPFDNLTTATLAFEMDGEPLGVDEGYLRIVDPDRSGNFHVGQVRELRVFTSTPIDIIGLQDSINASKVLTIGFIDSKVDRTVSYNDGQRDRTYPAIGWDDVFRAVNLFTDVNWTVSITVKDGTVYQWTSYDLINDDNGGLAVDSRGRYVGVKGQGEGIAIDIDFIDFEEISE